MNWRLSRDEVLADRRGRPGPAVIVASTDAAIRDVARRAAPRAVRLPCAPDPDLARWWSRPHPPLEPAGSRRRGAADLHVREPAGDPRACCSPTATSPRRCRERRRRGGSAPTRSACWPRRCSTSAASAGAWSACTAAPARSSSGRAPPTELADPASTNGSPTRSSCPRAARRCARRRIARASPTFDVIVYGAAPIEPETRTRVMDTFDCTPAARLRPDRDDRARSPSTSYAHDDRRDAATPRPPGGRTPGSSSPSATRPPCTALPAGSSGEVWTRSAQNTPGYAGDPTATQRYSPSTAGCAPATSATSTTTAGCFVTDRLKDLIITGGENVVPAEVESVLREHDDIADVAVVGLPDPRWGEVVTAVVVPRAGRTPSARRRRRVRRRPARRLQAAAGAAPRRRAAAQRDAARSPSTQLVEELSRDGRR